MASRRRSTAEVRKALKIETHEEERFVTRTISDTAVEATSFDGYYLKALLVRAGDPAYHPLRTHAPRQAPRWVLVPLPGVGPLAEALAFTCSFGSAKAAFTIGFQHLRRVEAQLEASRKGGRDLTDRLLSELCLLRASDAAHDADHDAAGFDDPGYRPGRA